MMLCWSGTLRHCTCPRPLPNPTRPPGCCELVYHFTAQLLPGERPLRVMTLPAGQKAQRTVESLCSTILFRGIGCRQLVQHFPGSDEAVQLFVDVLAAAVSPGCRSFVLWRSTPGNQCTSAVCRPSSSQTILVRRRDCGLIHFWLALLL